VGTICRTTPANLYSSNPATDALERLTLNIGFVAQRPSRSHSTPAWFEFASFEVWLALLSRKATVVWVWSRSDHGPAAALQALPWQRSHLQYQV